MNVRKYQALSNGLLAAISWVFILANVLRLWSLHHLCGIDGSGCQACYTSQYMCYTTSCTSYYAYNTNWKDTTLQWALLATLLYAVRLLLRVCEYTLLWQPFAVANIKCYPSSRAGCFAAVLACLGCYNPHLILDAAREEALQEHQQPHAGQHGRIPAANIKPSSLTDADIISRLGLCEGQLDREVATQHAFSVLRMLIEGIVFVLNLTIMINQQVQSSDFSMDWALIANCTRQVSCRLSMERRGGWRVWQRRLRSL